MANKRLANKVIAGLEDIMALSLHALRIWDKAKARAQLKCADPALLLALAEIKGDLAEIRLLAAAARQGEYAGKPRMEEINDDN
ncbi:MAG: hypothetical protein JXR84_08415 [Anaerolineae bacterium]|nr:hypothetical protein [Anaerolineae bacterium]